MLASRWARWTRWFERSDGTLRAELREDTAVSGDQPREVHVRLPVHPFFNELRDRNRPCDGHGYV
jgi:hypothetical protein